MTDELVEELALCAEYLRIAGLTKEAQAYHSTAQTLRSRNVIPADPTEIDGIGPAMRDVIMEHQMHGSIERLDDLQSEYAFYEEFRSLDGVGPARARKLYDAGISSRAELRDAIESEYILDIDGIGEATAESLLESLDRQR